MFSYLLVLFISQYNISGQLYCLLWTMDPHKEKAKRMRMTDGINNEMESVALSPDRNQKRPDYLEWSEYFMAVSFLSAMRSKDPATQVGACIVNPENRIVGIGYNGMPRGCSDDLLPWGKNNPDE